MPHSASLAGFNYRSPHLCLQEVRLYTALCLCHILRLNAPDTPYTDEQLQVGAGLQPIRLTSVACGGLGATAAVRMS